MSSVLPRPSSQGCQPSSNTFFFSWGEKRPSNKKGTGGWEWWAGGVGGARGSRKVASVPASECAGRHRKLKKHTPRTLWIAAPQKRKRYRFVSSETAQYSGRDFGKCVSADNEAESCRDGRWWMTRKNSLCRIWREILKEFKKKVIIWEMLQTLCWSACNTVHTVC